VPEIKDIEVMINILKYLGAKIEKNDDGKLQV
jgi:UDP-N-acetylglucosamine enolpyruvyl transferase